MQFGFLIERMEGGLAVVFVPDAPNPQSGSIYFMTEDRFKAMDIPAAAAMKCLRRHGVGAAALLRGRLGDTEPAIGDH